MLLDMLITIVIFFGSVGALFLTLHVAGKGINWLNNKANKKLDK